MGFYHFNRPSRIDIASDECIVNVVGRRIKRPTLDQALVIGTTQLFTTLILFGLRQDH
jgi:hypothetical protein